MFLGREPLYRRSRFLKAWQTEGRKVKQRQNTWHTQNIRWIGNKIRQAQKFVFFLFFFIIIICRLLVLFRRNRPRPIRCLEGRDVLSVDHGAKRFFFFFGGSRFLGARRGSTTGASLASSHRWRRQPPDFVTARAVPLRARVLPLPPAVRDLRADRTGSNRLRGGALKPTRATRRFAALLLQSATLASSGIP